MEKHLNLRTYEQIYPVLPSQTTGKQDFDLQKKEKLNGIINSENFSKTGAPLLKENCDSESLPSISSNNSAQSSKSTDPLISLQQRFHVCIEEDEDAKGTITECSSETGNPVQKPRSDVENSRQSKIRDVWLSRAICAFTVLSVICTVVVIVLTVHFAVTKTVQDENQYITEEYEALLTNTCLPCIQLMKDPFNPYAPDLLLESLTNKLVDGTQFCCANNLHQFSTLLEAMLREQETRPVPSSNVATFKFTPASAHKRLLEPHRISDSNEPAFNNSVHIEARMNPNDTDPLLEHVHGVEIEDTNLKIKYTGLYYVYSNIHFKANSSRPPREFKEQSWYGYVHRECPNHPSNTGILFKFAYTVCDDCVGHEETAFGGGVFHLQEGDILQVCLSGQGTVKFQKESTFVGLYMLASGDKKSFMQ